MNCTFALIDRTKLLSLAGKTVLALCALAAATSTARAAIPSDELLNSLRPNGDVNDYANLLSPAEKQALENRCKQLRDKTGSQLAIAILPSLKGGQIDDFSTKLATRWKVGEAGKNNGLLLLVALEEHHARVDVGRGLEPVLPDALAGRILDQELFPQLKQQHYFQGLQAAVNRICEIVEKGEPATEEQRRGQALSISNKTLLTIFLSVFVAAGAGIFGLGLGSKIVPLVLFGLVFGGVGFLMGGLTAAPLAPIVHAPIAAIMAWLGWRVGRKQPGMLHGRRGTSMGGPYWSWGDYMGSSSSGSWSSSSGGGFSGGSWGGFGGGDFGGGGASGSW